MGALATVGDSAINLTSPPPPLSLPLPPSLIVAVELKFLALRQLKFLALRQASALVDAEMNDAADEVKRRIPAPAFAGPAYKGGGNLAFRDCRQ